MKISIPLPMFLHLPGAYQIVPLTIILGPTSEEQFAPLFLSLSDISTRWLIITCYKDHIYAIYIRPINKVLPFIGPCDFVFYFVKYKF